MKSITKYTSIVAVAALLAAGCDSYQSHSPIPAFGNGASLVAVPKPWTSRPFFSAANTSSSVTFNFSSYNADELAKVDVFVTYLDNNILPVPNNALTGGATVANWVAPVTTGGMLIQPAKYLPQSGTAPVSISFTRYDQLIKLAASPLPKVLLATYNGTEISGDKTYTLSQLMTATGKASFTPAPANPAGATPNFNSQPAFMLVFEVTRKDGVGGTFSYVNSGPGITLNPATGKVVPHNWTDPGGVVRAYNVIETGTEGSPFIPGVAIRVAP